jgi:hypothetical protein
MLLCVSLSFSSFFWLTIVNGCKHTIYLVNYQAFIETGFLAPKKKEVKRPSFRPQKIWILVILKRKNEADLARYFKLKNFHKLL